jgi:DNA-directed RNA polymerase II subunit RPB7
MFFLKTLSHQILLHPSTFGSRLREHLRQRLHQEVEGTCTGRFGYIIAVASIEDIGTGRIQEGRGMAEYTVKYKAIVFKPFKGEVLEAKIVTVNKVRCFVRECFWWGSKCVHVVQMGFFAEAGPLTIFVSNHVSNLGRIS